MSESRKIRIRIDNVEIEVMGPEEFVSSKFEELEFKYIKNPPYPGPVKVVEEGGTTQTLGVPDNLPAFLVAKGEPKGQDLVLACGEWLALHKIEPFDSKDMLESITQTRYEAPKNIPRDLIELAKKGYLLETGKKYKISMTGFAYLKKMGTEA